jgi:hypothetical protein
MFQFGRLEHVAQQSERIADRSFRATLPRDRAPIFGFLRSFMPLPESCVRQTDSAIRVSGQVVEIRRESYSACSPMAGWSAFVLALRARCAGVARWMPWTWPGASVLAGP